MLLVLLVSVRKSIVSEGRLNSQSGCTGMATTKHQTYQTNQSTDIHTYIATLQSMEMILSDRQCLSVGGQSWTASRHLFSRLDAIQPLLSKMYTLWSIDSHESSQIGATRCQILRLKCTKFDFSWGPALPQTPLGPGELAALHRPHSWI